MLTLCAFSTLHSPFHSIALLGLLHLLGGAGHRAAADSAAEVSRGRKPHSALCVPAGHIQGALHSQLGIPVLPRGLLQAQLGRLRVRLHPDLSLRRLLLLLFHQVRTLGVGVCRSVCVWVCVCRQLGDANF
jgi:hypothetical protein